ncbi:MAG: 2-amino-4-hydroxy-6-hydroxymethyldihydropteridine diphosphokinase [Candidatus Thiodiazotropha endolucinida]
MTDRGSVHAWLSLGSNMAPENHIPRALRDLEALFGELQVSPIYESEAVGLEGDNFHNLVVGIYTDLSPRALVVELRKLEARHGRRRTPDRFASRTLDIDLLTYGDQIIDDGPIQLPRDEIVKYAFVLLPLSDVAGDELHPHSGRTYRQLWEAFDQSDQSLWRVEGRVR